MLAYPDVFKNVLMNTLTTGQFPSMWKRQKIVLIPKPGKPPGHPSALRPLGLVDNLAKVQEMVILDRLTKYTEGPHGLSDRQFGSRTKRSTVDAILAVLEKGNAAFQRKRCGARYCALITIDVKNAFNSASWEAIAVAVERMKISPHLCRLLRNYLDGRVLPSPQAYPRDQCLVPPCGTSCMMEY